MKLFTLYFVLALIIFVNALTFAATISIDGHVYLENQEYHDGIEITFNRTAPSELFDTTYTDVSGYYSIVIEEGIYDVNFSKSNYKKFGLQGQALFDSTTFDNIFLNSAGMSGSISGILKKGTYTVGGNL